MALKGRADLRRPGSFAVATLALAAGLAVARPAPGQAIPDVPAPRDTLIPAGYGTLRRDDVAVEVRLQGLTVRALPLEEVVIRTLAPDSYRSLHALRERHTAALDQVRRRLGLTAVQAWHVTFFNVQAGEARFDPRGMQIRSAGRDFRPLDVLPLVAGFEDGRLPQGRSVDAVFAFDPQVALDQPLVVTLAGEQSAAWNDVIPRLERERAAIWSRAAAARKPPPDRSPAPWR